MSVKPEETATICRRRKESTVSINNTDCSRLNIETKQP